jgi:actin-related protein 9
LTGIVAVEKTVTLARTNHVNMPPFKDEHILIIAPGSQTTLAQLGLPESFTPATHRFPSRVFPAPDGKTFEPSKVRSRKKVIITDGDVEMAEAASKNEEDEEELIELPEDEEGAIYPLKGTYHRKNLLGCNNT